MYSLSRLFESLGNYAEQKRLLVHTLTLEREQRDDYRVALTLHQLSRVDLDLALYGEGIRQAEEAFEIFKRLGKTKEQANCLDQLARSLLVDNQLDAAEDTVLRKIKLLPEKGQEFLLCQSHRLFGAIYRCKGEKEKSVHHFETALSITSPFDWQTELFWVHYAMAELFRDQGEFNNANAHVEKAKSPAADNPYFLGRGMEAQGLFWYQQQRLEDARSEVLGAIEIFERLGAANDAGRCRGLLRKIEKATGSQLSGKLGSGGEFSSYENAPHPFNFVPS